MGGISSRIDYSIFLGLCDTISVSYGEMLEAIRFAESCDAEERRTYSMLEANDIVNHIN